MDKKVAAVVVTYNRKELLKECVTALVNQNYKDLQILIVDNASTDGTQDFIKDFIDNKKVFYFNTGSNLGGAGGFNFGIKKAVEMSFDYVWIMDDDCIANKDSLTTLLDFATSINNNFGYLSSVVKWTDGSICKMNIQRTGLKNKITDFGKNQRIMLASFVSLFLNANAVKTMGLPFKEFFIWGDDWEYTYRLQKKYDCYLVANSVVTHKSKNNFGVNITQDTSDRLDRYFYYYRNEGFFYKQTGFKGRLYFFLKVMYHRFKILFTKCVNKKQKFAIMKKGLKALKTFDPKIEFPN